MKYKLLIAAALAALGMNATLVHAAEGWFLTGSNPKSYEIGEDIGADIGKAARYIRYTDGESRGFGTLMQQVSAKNYQGKRVRFQAMIKTREVSGWAGLWMRVDGPHQKIVAFYNSWDKPIAGTTDWQLRSVTLDVPADAAVLSFGVIDNGKGQVWIKQLSLEPVGNEVAVDVMPGTQPVPSDTPVL